MRIWLMLSWLCNIRLQMLKAYLFNVFNPEMTLSHVVQSVIRQVVGDNTMDHVLTTGREQVAQEVKTAFPKFT